MPTRHPLYERMIELGITLQTIADMTGRDRTTIQKQLTGVNPLKEPIRKTIEAVVEARENMQVGDSFQAWLDFCAQNGTVHVSGEPLQSGPLTVGQQLNEHIRCVEMTRDLMVQHGIETLDALLDMLHAQQQRLSEGYETRRLTLGSSATPKDARLAPWMDKRSAQGSDERRSRKT